MTINPGGRDDFAERTCHTARLRRKIIGVACDKMIVTAIAPDCHFRADGNPRDARRTTTRAHISDHGGTENTEFLGKKEASADNAENIPAFDRMVIISPTPSSP